MPRGMWLAVDSKQLESLRINVVGPAKSSTAKEWGTSSVLKSHGLVAMVSAELPGKWPTSWYLTGEPTKNDSRTMNFICLDLEGNMDTLDEFHPGVNVAML